MQYNGVKQRSAYMHLASNCQGLILCDILPTDELPDKDSIRPASIVTKTLIFHTSSCIDMIWPKKEFLHSFA